METACVVSACVDLAFVHLLKMKKGRGLAGDC
jgi:hypothetical protein